MKICISAITDIGKERTNNEDAVAVCTQLDTCLWDSFSTNRYIPLGEWGAVSIVADGMGGANAGEVASSIAIHSVINSLSKTISEKTVMDSNAICCFLKDAVRRANEDIMSHVVKNPDSIGLGTTIVIAWIINADAYIAWCGDCRCYSFNPTKGKLRVLTKDHSYVQELVDRGELLPENACNHPDSNIVTRCIGDVDANSEADVIVHAMKPGELLLSCSDGLCGYCTDSSMENILQNHFEDLDKCRDELLNLALSAGGYDNITLSLMATLPDERETPSISRILKLKRFLNKWF